MRALMGGHRYDGPGGRRVLLLCALVLLVGSEALDAQARWSPAIAGGMALRLTRPGDGSALGSFGGEVQLFRVPDAGPAWGISLGWRDFGRFDNPVPGDYRDESAVDVGVRLRSGGPEGGARPYATVGLDLLLVRERPATGSVGTDPGIGGYVGVGVGRPSWGRRWTPFAELGLHAHLATGEKTHGNGVFLSGQVGLVFE